MLAVPIILAIILGVALYFDRGDSEDGKHHKREPFDKL